MAVEVSVHEATPDDRPERDPRRRVLARRVVVIAVVVAQLALLARAYWAAHDEFGFQMFPESSQWQAEIVRVTVDGERVPIEEDWPGGYRWQDLVRGRGLTFPWRLSHADSGLDSQLAFFASALDWVAANTPDDTETRYLEATITYWRNVRGPYVETVRSAERDVDGGS